MLRDAELARSLQARLHRSPSPAPSSASLRAFPTSPLLQRQPRARPPSRSHSILRHGSSRSPPPEAASSEWVGTRTRALRSNRRSDRLLIVLTGGVIAWMSRSSISTGRLPILLSGQPGDPRPGALFRGSHVGERISQPNATQPRFADMVDIAATLYDRPKDELIGDDVRQYHRTRRQAGHCLAHDPLDRGGLGGLAAVDQRRTALAERDRAEEQARRTLCHDSWPPRQARCSRRPVRPRLAARGPGLRHRAHHPGLRGVADCFGPQSVSSSGTTCPESRYPLHWCSIRVKSRLVVGTEEGNVPRGTRSPWAESTIPRPVALGQCGRRTARTGEWSPRAIEVALCVWNVRTGATGAHDATGSPAPRIVLEEFDPPPTPLRRPGEHHDPRRRHRTEARSRLGQRHRFDTPVSGRRIVLLSLKPAAK